MLFLSLIKRLFIEVLQFLNCASPTLCPQSGQEEDFYFTDEELAVYSEVPHDSQWRDRRVHFDSTYREAQQARRSRKKDRKRRKNGRKKLNPQSGFIQNAVMAKIRGYGFNTDINNSIENTVILLMSLSQCTTVTQFSLTMLMYFKTLYTQSVTETACKYLSTTLGTTMCPQSGIVGDNEYPNWLRDIKELSNTWTLALHADGFNKIGKILSLCVALGLCKATDIIPTVNGLELFSLPLASKNTSVIGLVDAVFEMVIHFAEGGYLCFRTGSIKPLLYGSIEHQTFSDDFHKCMRCSNLHACGNLASEGLDDNGYDKLLEKTVERAERLLLGCTSSFEKAIFNRQIEKLNIWHSDFREVRMTGGLRVAPYAIGLFGDTAVGKSTLCPLIIAYVLKVNGFDASDNCTISLSDSDKYMSQMKSYVNCIIMDDIGNTKSEFVNEPPTARIIELINNNKAYAPMAEAEKKGKVTINPKLVIITKNVKDSGASVYSNAPASIARRDNVTITVKVKERFATNGMLDPAKIKMAYPGQTPEIPDFWEFWVEQAYPVPGPAGAQSNVGWSLVKFRGEELAKIDIFLLFSYLRYATFEHFAAQNKIVANAQNMGERMKICEHCKLPESFQTCPYCNPDFKECSYNELEYADFQAQHGPYVSPLAGKTTSIPHFAHKLEPDVNISVDSSGYYADCEKSGVSSLTPQLGKLDLFALTQKYWKRPLLNECKTTGEFEAYFTTSAQSIGLFPFTFGTFAQTKALGVLDWLIHTKGKKTVGVLKILEKGTTQMLINRCAELEQSPYFSWTTWIPENLYVTKEFRNMIIAAEWPTIRNNVISKYQEAGQELCGYTLLLLICMSRLSTGWWKLLFVIWLYFASGSFVCIAKAVEMEKTKLIEEISLRRDSVAPLAKRFRDRHLAWLLGSSAAMAAIYMAIKSYRRMQSLYQTQGNLAPMNYTDVARRDAEVNPWKPVVLEEPTRPLGNNGVSVTELSNLVLNNLCVMTFELEGKLYFCNAFFPKSNVAIFPRHMWYSNSFTAKFVRKHNCVGASFSAMLDREFSSDIPGTDMSLVWVPSGGDWKNLTRYFPTGKLTKGPAKLVYKSREGDVKRSSCIMTPNHISPQGVPSYDGATYTLEWDSFAGLCMAPVLTDSVTPCIAGFHLCGNGRNGALGTLTANLFDVAFEALKGKKAVFVSASDAPHDTSQFGITFFQQGADIHPKSAVRHLEGDPVIRVYGVVGNQSTPVSVVIESPISKAVTKHCGIPQLWGQPKFRKNFPWQASLQFSSQPALGLPAPDLLAATTSYVSRIQCNEMMWNMMMKCKPLSRIETVSGIDGVRFIDAIKANTSIGFPFSGKKERILCDVESEDHMCPKDVSPIFWQEFDRTLAKYAQGDRSTQIFKACMKDEPTKLDKDKVRIFQAAPLVLQLGVRMYFLPIARVLSLFPLVSECAVGINAESYEWHQLDDHVIKFGKDRIVAGDYSKYDLRMPAQLMGTAFRIMIDFAYAAKYSELEIEYMRGLATEICYAYTVYNGDLLKFFGSNPSGQNLTVYINSIVNSLILRCAFHSIYPKKSFNMNVSAITYGDDFKSGVSKDVPLFNHISMAQYLDRYGMKLTMPDKSSSPVPYLHSDNCDFLKRKTYFHPDLHCKVGILEDSSIFKSLHCVMKSKFVTPREVAAMNVDGALRSWFYHGREKFEEMQEKLQRVAYDCDISHMCEALHVSYEDFVIKWLDIHGKTLPLPEMM